MISIPLTPVSETYEVLFQQHQLTHLLMQTLGGCFPGHSSPLDQDARVCDLLCGSGAWSLACGRAYPSLQITGIDTDPALIAHARQSACVQFLSQVRYHVHPHPDLLCAGGVGSFDLVHVQRPDGTRHAWEQALRESWRLLRPGGKLCLVVWQRPQTNALAWEALAHLTEHTRLGADRRARGQCEWERRCFAAGFGGCRMQRHLIDYSYGMPDHLGWAHALLPSRAQQRRIVQTGVASLEQVEALVRQGQQEMRLPVFRARLPVLVLWATKGVSA